MNVRSQRQNGPRTKVVMLGPDLKDQGGMAAVEHVYLAAWDKTRYDLRHLGTYDSNAAQRVKLFMALRAFALLFYWGITWRPDVVHLHFAAGVSFYRKSIFVLLARLLRLKIILHCHAPNFDVFYEKRGKRNQRYIRWVLDSADRLIVVAEQWRKCFEDMGLRVPIITLYNSVTCPPDIQRATNGTPIVLTLGRLGERKGTYDILQAVPQVLANGLEADFWLGGDGEVEQVKSRLTAEPWGEHVRLLGWVRGEEKEKALAQASIFLLPSYLEGLPVAILEAMAYGLPIISTPVGGIPEAVVNGETGFLIEPGDVDDMVQKLTLLLHDAELRLKMGTSAKKRMIEKFDVDAVMEQLYKTYDSLKAKN